MLREYVAYRDEAIAWFANQCSCPPPATPGTIRRNLEALTERAPEAVAPYVALARMAAGLAQASGRLSPKDARRLEGVLDGWK